MAVAGFCLMLVAGRAGAAEVDSAILYIGDGMGIAQVTAARIYQGNARDGALALDTFENVAIVRTHSTDSMVTDSAAAGVALATGYKTVLGRISLDANNQPIPTVLEMAKRAGKSVGLVTNTTITHATPACFYAHFPSRYAEDKLADQIIDYADVDLLMGGGREHFLPKTANDAESGQPGSRSDDRNLIEEARAAGFRLIQKQSEFDSLVSEVEGGADPGKVLALFSHGHMAYEVLRDGDRWGEPSLEEMTRAAISILSRNPKGFFLMVEGGRIDHACHENRAHYAAVEVIEFDRAVAAGLEYQGEHADTMIVVTADHETGGLAINGYASIEVGGMDLFTTNPRDNHTDILTFATGPGADRAPYEGKEPESVSDRYMQPALMYAGGASHTGVDVMAWASGPGAERIRGTMQNSEVGKAIIESLGFAADDR